MNVSETIEAVTDWEFQHEPLWRWFLFIGAMLVLLYIWRVVLSFMRAA